jgi:hypothetical protein
MLKIAYELALLHLFRLCGHVKRQGMSHNEAAPER